MSDELLERAKQDMSKLDDVIRKAEDALQRAKAEREEIQAFIRVYERYAQGARYASVPNRVTKSTLQEFVGDVAERAIRAKGSPMPLGEIYDLVMSHDIQIGGEDKRQRVSQMLSRDNRFRNVPQQGWWLRYKPLGIPSSDEQSVTSQPERADESQGGEPDESAESRSSELVVGAA